MGKGRRDVKDKAKDSKTKSKVKKDKKEKKKSSSSSSSESIVVEDPAVIKEVAQIASTFGLKPKGLQITKNMTRLADLKVAQIASVLSQVHSCLTSQCLFTCGGELVEIHRKNLTSLKAHDDGSEAGLRARITASQKLQWAEKRWRDRLVSLFKEVAGLDNMSVISQHSSLVSLRRTIANEVAAHEAAADAAAWLAKLKQQLQNFKSAAGDDMRDDHKRLHRTGRSGVSPRKGRSPRKGQSPHHNRSSRKGRSPCKRRTLKHGSEHRSHRSEESPSEDRSRSRKRTSPSRRRSGKHDEGSESSESDKDRFHVFKEEIERFMASKADQHLFKKIVAAEGFEDAEQLLTGMAEGWELDETTVGAEGKELLGCMTWVGRRSAKKMCERIAGNMEEYGKKLGLEGFEEDTEVVAPNKKGKPKATHKQRESSERPEPVPRECQSPTEELPGLPEVPLSPSGSD
ncbi:unnamed protein product [Durusdinium trenchii]|uniref:Uncharacterized protein n=1 Tax=Durusdinium trenchii TaxID=1381693 RepID=A0ABP0NBV3_9DINO